MLQRRLPQRAPLRVSLGARRQRLERRDGAAKILGSVLLLMLSS